MVAPYAVLAGTQIASGILGSRSAKRAAQAQAEATRQAAELQLQAQREAIAAQNRALEQQLGEVRRQYDTTRSDNEPWRTTGVDALGQLAGLANYDPTPTAESVMADPGYQFGLTQGRNALEGSAAAAGGLYSGRALKELTQFGNDYGTTKFNDAFNRQRATFGDRWNRLSGLAGTGQTAVGQVSAAGQNMANTAAQAYGNNANATSNLLTGGANNMGSLLLGNANAQGASQMARANIWGQGMNSLAGLYAFGQGGMGGRTNADLGFMSPGDW